jgi:hypothetical protein
MVDIREAVDHALLRGRAGRIYIRSPRGSFEKVVAVHRAAKQVLPSIAQGLNLPHPRQSDLFEIETGGYVCGPTTMAGSYYDRHTEAAHADKLSGPQRGKPLCISLCSIPTMGNLRRPVLILDITNREHKVKQNLYLHRDEKPEADGSNKSFVTYF